MEEICLALIRVKRPQGGMMIEVLIDRLLTLDNQTLPIEAITPILEAIANCMDEAAREGGMGNWGRIWVWSNGEELFKKLFARLSTAQRTEILQKIFSSGKAIGWLMSELIRGEIFAHGRYGDQARPEEDWLFSDEQLDTVIKLLLDRLVSDDRDKIIEIPSLLTFLYGWRQSGDEDGARKWVKEQLADDAQFLRLLSGCRGWMQSDKTYYPLNRRDMENFMDFEEAVERIREISNDSEKTDEQRELAKELLEAAKLGKDE